MTSVVLSLSAAAGLTLSKPETGSSADAAGEVLMFDFGSGGTESGYTGVSASESYSSDKGYGFNIPSNMSDVSAAGSGALSDAVQVQKH
ncbi:MAG: hypothetical protein LUD57_06565 [Ruminococcus sp.]|nr:hypothetical protein [Ruminococcus sp.]